MDQNVVGLQELLHDGTSSSPGLEDMIIPGVSSFLMKLHDNYCVSSASEKVDGIQVLNVSQHQSGLKSVSNIAGMHQGLLHGNDVPLNGLFYCHHNIHSFESERDASKLTLPREFAEGDTENYPADSLCKDVHYNVRSFPHINSLGSLKVSFSANCSTPSSTSYIAVVDDEACTGSNQTSWSCITNPGLLGTPPRSKVANDESLSYGLDYSPSINGEESGHSYWAAVVGESLDGLPLQHKVPGNVQFIHGHPSAAVIDTLPVDNNPHSTAHDYHASDSILPSSKEMLYRTAVLQPIDLVSAETLRRPKRRNVRMSNDPQSVAARHRRERISDRIRILQRLVPGGTKMDTASMLEEAVHYLKFLKAQVQVMQSMANPSC